MIRTLTAIAVAALTLAACGGDRPASTVTEEDLPG